MDTTSPTELIATSDSSWIIADASARVRGHVTYDGGCYTAYDADEMPISKHAARQDAIDTVLRRSRP